MHPLWEKRCVSWPLKNLSDFKALNNIYLIMYLLFVLLFSFQYFLILCLLSCDVCLVCFPLKDCFCSVIYQYNRLDFYLLLSSNTYFRCEYVYISCLLSLPAHFPSVALSAMFSCGVQSVYGDDIECETALTSLPIPYWGQQVKRNVLNW